MRGLGFPQYKVREYGFRLFEADMKRYGLEIESELSNAQGLVWLEDIPHSILSSFVEVASDETEAILSKYLVPVEAVMTAQVVVRKEGGRFREPYGLLLAPAEGQQGAFDEALTLFRKHSSFQQFADGTCEVAASSKMLDLIGQLAHNRKLEMTNSLYEQMLEALTEAQYYEGPYDPSRLNLYYELINPDCEMDLRVCGPRSPEWILAAEKVQGHHFDGEYDYFPLDTYREVLSLITSFGGVSQISASDEAYLKQWS